MTGYLKCITKFTVSIWRHICLHLTLSNLIRMLYLMIFNSIICVTELTFGGGVTDISARKSSKLLSYNSLIYKMRRCHSAVTWTKYYTQNVVLCLYTNSNIIFHSAQYYDILSDITLIIFWQNGFPCFSQLFNIVSISYFTHIFIPAIKNCLYLISQPHISPYNHLNKWGANFKKITFTKFFFLNHLSY